MGRNSRRFRGYDGFAGSLIPDRAVYVEVAFLPKRPASAARRPRRVIFDLSREYSLPRLKLTLAYEGTRYAGWQMQATTHEKHPPTIQGELEAGISAITGYRVPVHGAGRTDAGVHAEGQVCHCDLPEDKQGVDWKRALNVRLPHDIRVLDALWVEQGFHSRKSALRKRYSYSLWMHGDRAVPRVRAFVWSCPPFDTARMREAAPLLTGRRDFASFRNSGANVTDSVRTLYSVEFMPRVLARMTCPDDWPVLSIVFEGDGFLRQMVRNLTGLLVWVGQGKIDADDIPAILAAQDRRALPSPSAPAEGLTLLEVVY